MTHPEELDALKQKWRVMQLEMKEQLSEEDHRSWDDLSRIGGIDISFSKESEEDACVTLVVLNYPKLDVIYEDSKMVKLDVPYLPGFLGFREVPHMVSLISNIRETAPDLVPEVVMVDGNGVLHNRGFGSASHLGVAIGIPTVGVAKKYFSLEQDGLPSSMIKPIMSEPNTFPTVYSTYPLKGDSGRVWGTAVRTTESSKNPVFVSVGTHISLAVAVAIVCKTSRVRVPEAVRQADLRSREFLRVRGLI
eukprot:TRINITY_DN27537_c0_g1_i1.p1 TRINITY_DN27537_c0_g1~~TRINITY_DN27537_c0_g1_i1.p1  ORF type:complete len:249 (+),score=33.75 TRINITY_DN27537_c0_g1_i1:55-801(+)